MIQGLAVGGEYGGAVVYVAEHSRPDRRGLLTGWIQIASSVGLLSIAVIIGTQSVMSETDFKALGIARSPLDDRGLAARTEWSAS